MFLRTSRWIVLLLQFFTASATVMASEERGSALVRDLETFARSQQQVFVIPPGEYLIPDRKGPYHIVLSGLKNKKIVGAGARLIFSNSHKGGIYIHGTESLTLEGIELDWRIKPYVVGKMLSISLAGASPAIEVEPLPEFIESAAELSKAEINFATIHEASGTRKLLPTRAVFWMKPDFSPGDRTVKLALLPQSKAFARYLKVGDWIVVLARHPGTHALLIDQSRQLTIDGIKIRTSPSMGIVARPGNDDLTIRNSVLGPVSPGKWSSLNADGIHLIGIGGKTVITGNSLDDLQDDAIVLTDRGVWSTVREGLLEFHNDASTGNIGNDGNPVMAYTEGGDGVILEGGAQRLGAKSQLALGSKAGLFRNGARVPLFAVENSQSSALISRNKIRNIRGTAIRIARKNVVAAENEIELITWYPIGIGPYFVPEWHPEHPAYNVVVEKNVISQPVIPDAIRDLRGLVEIACWPIVDCGDRNLNREVTIRGTVFKGGLGYARQQIYSTGN